MVFLALKISGTILVHIILFALFPAFQDTRRLPPRKNQSGCMLSPLAGVFIPPFLEGNLFCTPLPGIQVLCPMPRNGNALPLKNSTYKWCNLFPFHQKNLNSR